MNQNKKIHEYSTKILHVIGELFNEENENYIGLDELRKEDNLSEFFHALATIAPNYLLNKITEDPKDSLEFNHLAKQLCFKYMIREEKD